jgi:dynein heavy chain
MQNTHPNSNGSQRPGPLAQSQGPRAPAPPANGKSTAPLRDPNIVAQRAAESYGGVNPLLNRLYSSTAPGAQGGVPNVLSSTAKKAVEPVGPQPMPDAAGSRPPVMPMQPGESTVKANASSLTLFTPVKYSDTDVRSMLQRGAQATAARTDVVRRRQTPPARLVPLSSETALATTHHGGAQLVPVSPPTAGHAKDTADSEAVDAAALNVVSRFRTTTVNTPKEFTYLTMRPRGIRDMYNPYDLVVVSHKEVNAQHYFTVSTAGVTKFDDGESEFIDLKAWEREHRIFHKLIKLDVFRMYKQWKGFNVWHKLVRRTSTQTYKNHLHDNLFSLHIDLSASLRHVRRTCLEFQNMTIYVPTTKTETLQSYCDVQHRQLESVRRKLEETIKNIRNTLEAACNVAMGSSEKARERELQQGSSLIDDPTKRRAGAKRSGLLPDPAASGSQDQAGKTSYIEQSQKRAVCRRLTSYIRLCDYMVINSLAILSMKAIRDAHTDLQYPRPAAPTPAVEEKPSKDKDAHKKADAGKKKKDEPQGPFQGMIYTVDILYAREDQSIIVSPNQNGFMERVEGLLKEYIKLVSSIPRLAQMENFKKYTEAAMVDHGGDSEVGLGPDVGDMVTSEDEYKSLYQGIRNALNRAFQAVDQYAATYDVFRDMYVENSRLNPERIKKLDHGLDWFNDELAKFRKQSQEIERIPKDREVALFQVKTEQLREFFTPSPMECTQKLHDLLPIIAREKNQALLDDLQVCNKYLEDTPKTVEKYVEYTDFFTKLEERMDTIHQDFGNLVEMWSLLSREGIHLPEEDDLTYRNGTKPQYDKLRANMQMVEDGKEMQVRHFARNIEEQLEGLRVEMQKIVADAKNPAIDDHEADMDQVIELTTELKDRTMRIVNKERDLTRFQELFGYDPTPIPELRDEVAKDINDKVRIWTGLRDWTNMTQQYAEMPFKQIEAAAVNDSINTYSTLVKQVARTQRTSAVVPMLKERVEEWRKNFPIIQALKNPKIKDHHRKQLDDVIGKIPDQNGAERYLSEIDYTLGTLLRREVTDVRDEILIISVTATEEDKLDQALDKVKAIWQGGMGKQAVEFGIIEHKDQKEKYVLTAQSVEEVSAQLEDSLLVISTIAASKYCAGSLKLAVEKWEEDVRASQIALDKWLELQRNWMYLENIFASPEIRNQQWKAEGKKFEVVDNSFKALMRKTQAVATVQNALMANARALISQFDRENKVLESVLASLEKKLDERRRKFPRFYFLSNDDLLDVIAKTRQPEAIMQHMLKMFDGIKSLRFSGSMDILALISMEGEVVELANKTIKAGRGSGVEAWLIALELEMFSSLRKLLRRTVEDYEARGNRTEWIFQHPVQLVLIASQCFWSRGVEQALEAPASVRERMKEQQQLNYQQLADLASLTGRKLNRVQRGVLSTLITIDVHGRDLVDEMVENNVSAPTDFGWTKQLRCNWEDDGDGQGGNMFVRQNNSRFVYGYEYLGAQGRLVITPLTDRVYMTITGALKLYLGAAPAGPAGTGKTETTKDLAKNLARQCIVYNCSDGVTYKMMEKFFLGLIQTGAWTCLDEFNRINIEVLSVIAAQLNEIKLALQSHQTQFTFQGIKDVDIRETYGVFITMNPGYAGRTELPDNLKILFRPVAVMTPDFRMIAEVILYSEGFTNAKDLSLKITQLYKLSSEQLSPQDHYDFGMRALKSILVMAGDLKRSQPTVDEDLTLIVACNDSNVPKFVADDVPLFNGIMADLFPGAKFPERDYPELLPAMEQYMKQQSLTGISTWVKKGIQYYETLIVRHGVMLVGATGTGKTEARECIAFALDHMYKNKSQDKMAQEVNQYIINPKSIYMHELYGILDVMTNEWRDGHLAVIAKRCVKAAEESRAHSWIVFDGPVDTLWIESMNSVLDDSKLLCLDNGDRLKFPDTMHLLFEVADLAVASPATVSRCGMVYVDSEDLPWTAIVDKWCRTKLVAENVEPHSRDFIVSLFLEYMPKGLNWLRQNQAAVMITGGTASTIQSCCDLFTATLRAEKVKFTADPKDGVVLPPDDSYWKDRNETCRMLFAYCFAWAIGANVDQAAQDAFDAWQRDLMEAVPFPSHGSVFDFFVDFSAKKFTSWEAKMGEYAFNSSTAFFDILVPTIDTVRYSHVARTLVAYDRPLLFTGHTGVGKSVIMNSMLTENKEAMNLIVIVFQFSAQTSSPRSQEMIESKLKVKRKDRLGAPPDKKIVLFIDDLNMPALETFGASPPVELLRQMMGNGGFYDRKVAGFWKSVEDVTVVSACGPPEGGRNPVTARLTRMFHIMQIPNLSEESMKRIFVSILTGFFHEKKFNVEVRDLAKNMIAGSVEIFQRIKDDLRPRPATPHYTFNLRDIAKVCQGLMQVAPRVCNTGQLATKLWIHENMRCFYDRLTSVEDRQYFTETLLMDIIKRLFPGNWSYADLFEGQPIIWGDFLRPGAAAEDRLYEPATDLTAMGRLFDEYLEDYNSAAAAAKDSESAPMSSMDLVFFRDHCEHLARIIRIIRQPRGNALLVGVGGSGKSSLTRLASSIAEYKRFEIAVAKGYSMDNFHEKLLTLYEVAGVKCTPLVFLINDSQIVHEGMLEDINNILNSGEVPSLFSPEERDKKINACSEAARNVGITTRDEIWAFFISRVRDNFHTVLCMSPVGDAFRTRCRQFPSLTNCCSIDWFNEWPREALQGVAERLMAAVEFGDGAAAMRVPLTDLCVTIHTTVTAAASDFWEELRRRYYITPTSYLEFISLYKDLLAEKSIELTDALDRLNNGKVKMRQTNETIDKMKIELEVKKPKLEVAQRENDALVADLKVRTDKAETARVSVEAKELEASQQQRENEALDAEATAKLASAMPAVERAVKALDAIDKSDLSELKSAKTVSNTVERTIAGMMCFFEDKKSDFESWGGSFDWKGAREFLSVPPNRLLDKLKTYDKNNMTDRTVAKVKKIIDQEPDKLTAEICETKGSKACKSIFLWMSAMIEYRVVYKEVKPLQEAKEEAAKALDITTKVLNEARAALKAVNDELSALQQGLAESTARKERLEQDVATCEQRLRNAESLSSSLKNEAVRWDQNIVRLGERLKSLPVDMFLSAACIAYFGAFTSRFRKRLVAEWIEAAKAKNLEVKEDFTLVNALGDPTEILNWQICNLPTDETSTENAIIVTSSHPPRRWPLLIDPQGQASRWLQQRAKQLQRTTPSLQMRVIKLTDGRYMTYIEAAVRDGNMILADDVGETLDPALEPLLMRQIFQPEIGGEPQIYLTPQSQVSYNDAFRFYVVTKLSNPHYLPDVTIKVTLVNFTVTMEGLEDQMLGEVVAIERRELEDEKNRTILNISNDQKSLKKMEESILDKLKNAQGNILDNDALIAELKTAQSQAAIMGKRQEDAKEKIAVINKTRELYRPVANRCSILFFVLADLALIDPMYQNSLEFFKRLVATVVESTEKPEGFDPSNPMPQLFDQHLQNLKDKITEATYLQVCRGLFNKDKTILSLLMCTAIARNAGGIADSEWQYFIRATAFVANDLPALPENLSWVSNLQWGLIEALGRTVPAFKGLLDDVKARPALWKQWVQAGEPHLTVLPGGGASPEDADGNDWENSLTVFQKILLIRAWREEKLLFALTEYVKVQMGKQYVEAPPFDLQKALDDSSIATPIVFILSQGADPMNLLQNFANSHGKKLHPVSLGQGQGENAKKAIEGCRKSGDWALLQNCHLSKTFMPELEAQVSSLANPGAGAAAVHKSFRLWLTSMPVDFFPVFVLQNSVKLTNEPPTGLKANMTRCYNEISEAELEIFDEAHRFPECSKELAYKKMLYALCFFHSVVLERKKFGPLGWNVLYEWNDTDFHVSKQWLQLFLQEQAQIPWESLEYIIGQINYGGRVTDPQDRGTLMIILQQYLNPKVLRDDYKFATNPAYCAPETGSMQHYRDRIGQLSIIDDPDVFGMHENANLRFQLQRSELLMGTILSVQPRLVGSKGGGPTPEDQVTAKCEEFLSMLPDIVAREEAGPTTFTTLASGLPNSMSTVLSHELVKYNALLQRIGWSLEEMKKALKGLTVLSEDLDRMYYSFLNDQVPTLWSVVGYASLKNLGAWFKDLVKRIQFIRTWVQKGEPKVFWIGGFFNASAFMTGALQAFARQHGVSVDKLGFSFSVLDEPESSITSGPESGTYVSGIYTDAWRWDPDRKVMADSLPGEPYDQLPVMHFLPEPHHRLPSNFHSVPVYRTTIRKGVISSLGASSNYVLSIEAPTDKPRAYWTLKGAACVCALNN